MVIKERSCSRLSRRTDQGFLNLLCVPGMNECKAQEFWSRTDCQRRHWHGTTTVKTCGHVS